MPYIDRESRARLDAEVDALIAKLDLPHTAQVGALNYAITRLLAGTLLAGNEFGPPRYFHHNAAVGVLECAKLELYARRTRPYEDAKLVQHGDVR